MSRIDELRLMTKVARLYYVDHLRQTEIAEQLDISQATTSRLLKRAQEEQIVRITLNAPVGTHADLERQLESTYGLKEALVVESLPNEKQIMRDLGSAAAHYLNTTIKPNEVIGISSWSATLLAAVDANHKIDWRPSDSDSGWGGQPYRRKRRSVYRQPAGRARARTIDLAASPSRRLSARHAPVVPAGPLCL